MHFPPQKQKQRFLLEYQAIFSPWLQEMRKPMCSASYICLPPTVLTAADSSQIISLPIICPQHDRARDVHRQRVAQLLVRARLLALLHECLADLVGDGADCDTRFPDGRRAAHRVGAKHAAARCGDQSGMATAGQPSQR